MRSMNLLFLQTVFIREKDIFQPRSKPNLGLTKLDRILTNPLLARCAPKQSVLAYFAPAELFSVFIATNLFEAVEW
jgi:hypothetical protein